LIFGLNISKKRDYIHSHVENNVFNNHSKRILMGEVRGAYNILVGRPEGKRPLGRPRRRWEDNIKMYLREIGFEDVDWIHWAQDRDRWRALVNTVMNLRVP
jgi:hypothetical protein